jgi:hypothetical protein
VLREQEAILAQLQELFGRDLYFEARLDALKNQHDELILKRKHELQGACEAAQDWEDVRRRHDEDERRRQHERKCAFNRRRTSNGAKRMTCEDRRKKHAANKRRHCKHRKKKSKDNKRKKNAKDSVRIAEEGDARRRGRCLSARRRRCLSARRKRSLLPRRRDPQWIAATNT